MRAVLDRLIPLLVMAFMGAAGSLTAAQVPAYFDAFCRGIV